MPTDGERAWKLWLIPRIGEDAILLDEHPGDEEVPSLVPSFSVNERQIAWTSFARGPSGPVSRLLYAAEPDWSPTVLREVAAEEAELWLPSLFGARVAFTEVRYAPDRLSDERSVHLMTVGDAGGLRRLDTSGLATMPLLVSGAVLWKEADPGFNMFNWGRMYRFDLETEHVTRLDTWPQEYVNYPSAGLRFVAWWGADSSTFGLFDLVRGHPRLVQGRSAGPPQGVVRPHVAGDLAVWLHVDGYGRVDAVSDLRYALLPPPKELGP
jgi:hypothetical protein